MSASTWSHATDSDTWSKIKTASKPDAWWLFTQSPGRYSHIQMITVLGITNSFYHLNFRQNILITWIIASRLILYKTSTQKLWSLSHDDWNPYVPSYLEDWPIRFSWFPSSPVSGKVSQGRLKAKASVPKSQQPHAKTLHLFFTLLSKSLDIRGSLPHGHFRDPNFSHLSSI